MNDHRFPYPSTSLRFMKVPASSLAQAVTREPGRAEVQRLEVVRAARQLISTGKLDRFA